MFAYGILSQIKSYHHTRSHTVSCIVLPAAIYVATHFDVAHHMWGPELALSKCGNKNGVLVLVVAWLITQTQVCYICLSKFILSKYINELQNYEQVCETMWLVMFENWLVKLLIGGVVNWVLVIFCVLSYMWSQVF